MKRLKFSKEEIASMPTIEHFKISADDVERAQKFYKDVFDWTIKNIVILIILIKIFGILRRRMKRVIKTLKEE